MACTRAQARKQRGRHGQGGFMRRSVRSDRQMEESESGCLCVRERAEEMREGYNEMPRASTTAARDRSCLACKTSQLSGAIDGVRARGHAQPCENGRCRGKCGQSPTCTGRVWLTLRRRSTAPPPPLSASPRGTCWRRRKNQDQAHQTQGSASGALEVHLAMPTCSAGESPHRRQERAQHELLQACK